MDKTVDISPDSAWSRAVETLQKELSAHVIDRWIKPIKPVSIHDEQLVLSVPDDFFKTWVVDHYGSMISLALKELAGEREIKPSFIIAAGEPAGGDHENDALRSSAVRPSRPSPGEYAGARTLPAQPVESVLNDRYTFESFVVGPSNRFAHAASMAVAETPAKAYNPLFIYGPVGLGKTHLMQAIGHEVLQRYPENKVLYITSEKFTNELINSIQNRTTLKFREKFRTVDILLIDDIHFIGGKEATQEEFFHTFNALYDNHKQIVVSSDRQPKEINHLEERLVSRFEWGLVTDIQPADFETRSAILRKKAGRDMIEVPDGVTNFIAEKVQANIRELEGALNRVVAYSQFISRPITLDLAHEVLKNFIQESERKVTIPLIQKKVSERFNVKISDLSAKRRTKNVVLPRQVAMFLARELTGFSLPEIGGQFGGRDHTTVLHACDKIRKVVDKDPGLRDVIREIRNGIVD